MPAIHAVLNDTMALISFLNQHTQKNHAAIHFHPFDFYIIS